MPQFLTQGGIESFQHKSSPQSPFNSHLIHTLFSTFSLDLFHLASLQTLKMFVTFE